MSKFVSTRNANNIVNEKEAIINGLSTDGGLYTFDSLNKIELNGLLDLSNQYTHLAYYIISKLFDTLSKEELKKSINSAYSKFYYDNVVKTTKIGDDFLLELYHGPTSAFKDVALTLLPFLLSMSYKDSNINKLIYILCATSGDTGKAALEGFKDVDNTFITVLYPNNFVSKIQKLQMVTTTGMNTNVVSVNGNFDDCQRIIKNLMSNRTSLLNDKNVLFSSANSINIGRLVPQIVYYFKSYFDLINNKIININDKVNFSVPTGNFGDILAGYIAKNLGLPINKLICASNQNNVLTDFINTGVYNIDRKFYNTYSPSMDILVSSNLERLLFMITKDSEYISYLMKDLNDSKQFTIDKKYLEIIKNNFVSYYTDDETTLKTIHNSYYNNNRLIDPHTACAVHACENFKKEYNDKNYNIILSTASPYKFASTVLKAINNNISNDEFVNMNRLYELTNEQIPINLKNLLDLQVLHNDNINVNNSDEYIKNKINILDRG